jgi:predicted nucleotidyltransferase
MKDSQIKALLRELRAGLEELYGDRLKGVYLYGSYARGEEDRESDLDIVVVLDDFKNGYGAEIGRTGQLGSDLSLKYGVSISKVYAREPDWLGRKTPFLDNIRDEARAA